VPLQGQGAQVRCRGRRERGRRERRCRGGPLMTAVAVVVGIVYLIAATTFVLGLHLMRSPATARRGNLLSASGMAAAILATVALVATEAAFHVTAWGWIALGTGTALGGVAGAVSARRVKMTAMPQLVSLFNAVGGGAAAVIAFPETLHALDAARPPVSLSLFV